MFACRNIEVTRRYHSPLATPIGWPSTQVPLAISSSRMSRVFTWNTPPPAAPTCEVPTMCCRPNITKFSAIRL